MSIAAVLLQADTADLTDDGSQFEAYVTSRAIILVGDLTRMGRVTEPSIHAKSSTGAIVTVMVNREFSKETKSGTVLLTPDSVEYRVIRKAEGIDLSDIGVVQVRVGDNGPISQAWSIDIIEVPVIQDGDR